jgi:hypothetical protein
MSPTDHRLRLRRAGFSPVPCTGKAPAPRGWQTLADASESEIESWARFFPSAENTGVLTALTPALDIDIKDPDAADAVERLVRGRFEERGEILPRFGQAPKRAILFRTDAPFKKLKYIFGEVGQAERDCEKLEFMGDGQQLVVSGTHPTTNRPYTWHADRAPGEITREDLPDISEQEAKELAEACAALLINNFGYKLLTKAKAKKPNGEDTETDWTVDFSSHDSLASFIMKMISGGTNPGLVFNLCHAQIAAHVADPERKARRLKELPGMVDSAVAKIEEQKPQLPPPEPQSLAEVHAVFKRWLGEDYDVETLDAVLAVAASEKLLGDPVWLLVVAGSGNAKTETVQSVSRLDGAEVVSTITSEGALLSASSGKKARDATGGLLRKLGKRGILVVKDFTSILSMGREIRNSLLAAFREIHDGRWSRNVGSDGGRTITWEGRIVVIAACTTAWDQAHTVVSTMGDRFVLIRPNSREGRAEGGTKAMRNTGDETKMRAELAAAVAGVMTKVDVSRPYPLTEPDIKTIVEAADLVTLARTGVELDYRGDVIDAHDPEMPTRFAKQLTQILRGAIALGMGHAFAMQTVLRCARDSIPQLRLTILRDVADNPSSRVFEVRRRVQKPRATVDRTLQALHMLGLLCCDEQEVQRDGKTCHQRYYSLAAGISLAPLRLEITKNVSRGTTDLFSPTNPPF